MGIFPTKHLQAAVEGVRWVRLLALSCLYAVAAQVGLLYASAPESVTAIWPASGIFLAALLLANKGERPWYLVILGLIQFATENASSQTKIIPDLVFTAFLVIEAYLGLYLIERYAGWNVRFERTRDVNVMILASCLFAIPLTALPCAYINHIYYGGGIVQEWWHWTLGGSLGVLVMCPLLVNTLGKPWWRDTSRTESIELLLSLCGTIALTYYIFRHANPAGTTLPDYAYLSFLSLIYAAIRLGMPGFSFVALALAATALIADFSAEIEGQKNILVTTGIALEEFLLVSATAGLLLCATLSERKYSVNKISSLYQQTNTSEAMLTLTFNSIGDALIVTNEFGKISRVNPEAARLLGNEAELLIGREVNEVMALSSDTDGAQIESPVEEVLLTGEIVHMANNVILHSRDGNNYNIANSAAPIRDSEGKLRGVVMVASDVTEAHRMRRAVEQQSVQLQGVADALNAWVLGIDTSGRVEFANRASLQAMGLTLEDVRDKLVWELPASSAGKLEPRVIENFFRRCLLGESYDGEIEVNTVSGAEWLGVRVDPVMGSDGKPIQVIVEAHLLTELKQLTAARDQQLERSVKEQAALVQIAKISAFSDDTLHDGIKRILELAAAAINVEMVSLWQLADNDQVLDCLDLYTATTKSHAGHQQLMAKDYPRYFSALHENIIIAANDAHSDPRTSEFSSHYLTPQKISSMLDVRVVVSDEFDGVLCCEHVGEQRVWLDDEIAFAQAIADNLARVIADAKRFSLIEEQQLLQKQLALAEKMEALDQLSAGIAHDYNNMLNVILGFSEIIKAGTADTATTVEYAENIIQAAERGRALNKKLISFSSHNTSTEKIIDVNQVISNVLPLLRPSTPENVAICTELDDELASIEISPGDLEDAIVNIAINGLHSISGAGKLLLATRNLLLDDEAAAQLAVAPGRYVELRVSDTGAGIPQDILPRVLQPYFTTKGDIGTGLGLAQVDSLVRHNGGCIQIDSIEGKGTTFRLILPATQPQTSDPEPLADREQKSVLLVDDDPMMRELAQTILSYASFQVVTEESGAAALARLENSRYDLVITDQQMPGMSGSELAAQISELHPGLPVLLVSGEDISGIPRTWQEQLGKPYQAQELLEHVNRTLLSDRTPQTGP